MYKNWINVFLLLSACLTISFAANGTETNDGEKSSSSSGAQPALEPLYKMTNGFLKAVFTDFDQQEILNLILGVISNNSSSGGITTDEIWPTTQKAFKSLAGFAACVVIGIILLIVMPFTGCFCCCCRLCGKCGGKAPEYDPKHAKCKRIITGLFMLIFTLITLGGVVMIFFVGSDINDLLANKRLIDELKEAHADLQKSADSTTDQITGEVRNWAANNNINQTIDTFFDDMTDNITNQLLNSGSTTDVKDKANQLVTAIGYLNQTVSDFYTALKGHNQNLESAGVNLTQTAAHPSLSGTSFKTNLEKVAKASTSYDFTDVLNKTGEAQKKFNNIPVFKDLYDKAIQNVTDYIKQNLATVKTDVTKNFPNITEVIEPALVGVENIVNGTFGEVTKALGSASGVFESDTVKAIGNYSYIGASVIGGIIAVIVLFLLIGIACGFGGRPKDGSCSTGCNKGAGANCLLAAVGLMFIFFALFMLFTIVLFTPGSLTSSQVCWTLQEPDKYPLQYDFKQANLQAISQFDIKQYLDIYAGCLDGETIGEAAQSVLGKELQHINQQIENELQKLNLGKIAQSFSINANQLNLLPTSLNTTLTDLSQFDNSISNEQNLTDALKHNPLTQLQPILNALNTEINRGNTYLRTARDQVKYAIDVREPAITQSATTLTNALQAYTSTNKTQPAERVKVAAQELLMAIGDAKTEISNNTQTILNQTIQNLIVSAENLVRSVGNEPIDLATSVKCEKLGKSVRKVVNVVCETSLNPINGLWFSLGWCLIFFIPNIIVALCLTSLYRRLYSYEKNIDHELNYKNESFRDDYGKRINSNAASDSNGFQYYYPPSTTHSYNY